LNVAHSVILDNERAEGKFLHTGALAYDIDDRVPALQAADVIAWAARKRELLGGSLPEGFEPLLEALRPRPVPPHAHIPIPRDGLKMLADPIHRWICRRGSIPLLGEVIIPGKNAFTPGVGRGHEDPDPRYCIGFPGVARQVEE
jgi:hypothetical protein